MIYMSQQDIDRIGDSVLADYAMMNPGSFGFPFNIELFALIYLGLRIDYRKLSDDGSVLGLTSYEGITVKLPLNDGESEIYVPDDTIYLDEMLRAPDKIALRRFTIAHECGHQLLARIEERRTGYSLRRHFEPGKQYTYGEIKAAEYVGEWQANAVAAALLMPKSALTQHFSRWRDPHKLTSYGGRFNLPDYKKLMELTGLFNVSRTAMKIRLKEIGHIVYKPKSEYRSDPLDIFVS